MLFLSDEKKERVYMLRFRAELAFWGFDTSDLTDEEIMDAHTKVWETMRACGLSAEEVGDAISGLASAAQEAQRKISDGYLTDPTTDQCNKLADAIKEVSKRDNY